MDLASYAQIVAPEPELEPEQTQVIQYFPDDDSTTIDINPTPTDRADED